jgi:hypothetical protein
MLSLDSSLTLSRALKRSVNTPSVNRLLNGPDYSFDRRRDQNLWDNVNPDRYSFMGYSTRGFRVVERVEGSDEPLPILGENDILFYTLIDESKAGYEIRKMRAVNVKFLEGRKITSFNTGFMSNMPTLKRVCFGNFNSLTIVRSLIMSECRSLLLVSFKGLSKVLAMGREILLNCESLTFANFEGLISLKSLGDYNFYGCKSLKYISFDGLRSLKRLPECPLGGNGSLKYVSLRGVKNITEGEDRIILSEYTKTNRIGMLICILKRVGDSEVFEHSVK